MTKATEQRVNLLLFAVLIALLIAFMHAWSGPARPMAQPTPTMQVAR